MKKICLIFCLSIALYGCLATDGGDQTPFSADTASDTDSTQDKGFAPVVDSVYVEPKGNKQIIISITSSDFDGYVVKYVFIFSSEYDNWIDTVTFTEDEKTLALPYKGKYSVDYYAVDNDGYLSDKRSLEINISQVSPKLDAKFILDGKSVTTITGYAPAELQVDLSGSTPGESQDLSYYIDFGDGNISTTAIASNSYQNVGSYTLRVAVKDNKTDGVTVSKTYDVNITTADAPLVYINASASKFYLGDILELSASITTADGVEISDYNWLMIDDEGFESILSKESSAQYVCNEFVGVGKVKLIVTDDKGNKVSKVFSFEVENRVPSLRYIVLDDKVETPH